jgi:hypothetical protein
MAQHGKLQRLKCLEVTGTVMTAITAVVKFSSDFLQSVLKQTAIGWAAINKKTICTCKHVLGHDKGNHLTNSGRLTDTKMFKKTLTDRFPNRCA